VIVATAAATAAVAGIVIGVVSSSGGSPAPPAPTPVPPANPVWTGWPGAPDGRVFLLDVATRTVRATLTDRAEERYAAAEGVAGLGMQAVTFGDHGRLLAAATTTYVALWDVATGRLLARLGEAGRQELGQPYALAFSPDGKLLVTSNDRGDITEWYVR
jgi:WD40 repeat protein